MARRVRYLDPMEPPVQCGEGTASERIVAATHDTLAVGRMPS
jgi:hypothetical protein